VPPSGTNSRGGAGGGQVGCNYQTGQYVFGVEGDIDAMRLSGSVTTTSATGAVIVSPGGFFPSATLVANEQVSQNWLGTVRGRLGVVVQERLLLFVTGGLAVGDASTSGSISELNAFAPPGQVQLIWSGASSSTRVGYAVGGGAEYALFDRWSVKGEYLFYDLGTISHPLNLSGGTGVALPGIFPTLGNTSSRLNGNIVRIGLNYRFGGP
jgi:outer membrane immunogenic protein